MAFFIQTNALEMAQHAARIGDCAEFDAIQPQHKLSTEEQDRLRTKLAILQRFEERERDRLNVKQQQAQERIQVLRDAAEEAAEYELNRQYAIQHANNSARQEQLDRLAAKLDGSL